jgi:hypothetical protein
MAVVASATGAAVFGLTAGSIGAGLAGGALLGAGIGGLYSAFTGDGDILNSMLTGGLLGGAAGGLGAAYGGAATAAEAATAAGATGTGAVGPAATTVNTMTAAQAASATPAQLNALAAAKGVVAEGAASTLPGLGMTVAPEVVTPAMIEAGKAGALKTAAGLTGKEMLGYGLAGTAGMQLLGGSGKGAQAPASAGDPGMIRPFEYSSTPNEPTGNYPSPYATASYDQSGNPIMDTRERNYFTQDFAAMQPYSARTGTVNPNIPLSTSNMISAANGGIMRNYDDELGTDDIGSSTQGNMQKGLFGLGYAAGGHLGDYSDGGRLLRGPGDGVSDDIPATIANKQPARLADGEFVIPARIVSEIGNGSTDAGAKRLYAMMDKIQSGRKKTVGKGDIAKDTKAKKHLLA